MVGMSGGGHHFSSPSAAEGTGKYLIKIRLDIILYFAFFAPLIRYFKLVLHSVDPG